MFGDLWPGFDPDDVPITSVTNGVHAPTWVDPMLGDLAESALDTWDTTKVDWTSDRVSDHDFWTVHAARCACSSSPTRAVASSRHGRSRTPAPGCPPWVRRGARPGRR